LANRKRSRRRRKMVLFGGTPPDVRALVRDLKAERQRVLALAGREYGAAMDELRLQHAAALREIHAAFGRRYEELLADGR